MFSDPYLIGFYDKRRRKRLHDSKEPVTFTLEVDPIGHGPWMSYKQITVLPGKTIDYPFPDAFLVRWIRFAANKDRIATSWLIYN